ncbi:MAG TPA: hypothetical protein VFS39_11415 [Nitrospira sp.]|nr:hypothetical protein [Nitrospira sp.]
MRYGAVIRTLLALLLFISFSSGCARLPPLAEQEQRIRDNQLLLHQLTPRAFVGAWGMPPYQRSEFMEFFGMKDGSLVPRSRLAIGEAPRGWETGIEAGEGLFLAYPERGWLVVFYDERLVYKEALTAAQLHDLGRSWQHEDKFKTKLELPPSR